MTLIGYKAKNHPQQTRKRGADDSVDERITPDSIFAPLHELHRFTLDAAANKANARVPRFFDRSADGLNQPWAGERVWVNPPYSDCGAWVLKAINERLAGCPLVVLLLPANRCEQGWWQTFIEPYRDRDASMTTRFLPGRPRFGWPAGRVVPVKGDRPPFGLVVVTMQGRGAP